MSKKFSDLTQLTTPANGDLLPIDDVSAGSTKRITLQDLIKILGVQVTSYTNGGSAGGTFYSADLGGIKLVFGTTASVAVSGTGFQSATAVLNFPASFFSGAPAVIHNPGVAANTQYLETALSAKSASAVTLYLNQSNGTNGAAPIEVIAIGS